MPKQAQIKSLRFRFPDNPNEVGPAVLLDIERREKGLWYGQLKWDGWRSLIYKEAGRWVRHSKYDTGPQAKTPIPNSLIHELDVLGFPNGTAFDGEWMGMRAVNHLRGRHYLILYDLHYLGWQWQGDLPYEIRLAALKELIVSHKARCKTPTPNIELIETVDAGMLPLFQRSKTMPLTEGIVIKRRDSRLKGGLSDSMTNPQWMKIKWRA